MLKVFGENKAKVGEFQDYDALLGFIISQENQSPPSLSHWSFFAYSAKRLEQLCRYLKPESLTRAQLIALENQLGLIESCSGDFTRLQEVVITPEIDVIEHQKKWCLDYCRFKKWRVTEVVMRNAPVPLISQFVKRTPLLEPCSKKYLLSRRKFKKPGERLKTSLNTYIERLKTSSSSASLIGKGGRP